MTDIRDAFRTLRSTPVVTTVAILSLALGIGANTAIFSILDTLLLRSLPVKAPQELAIITHGSDNDSFTYPIWEEVRKRSQLFADVAAWTQSRFDTAQGGQARFVSGMLVSGRLGDRGVARRAAANQGGHDPAELPSVGHMAIPEGTPDARARRDRFLVPAHALPAAAHDDSGGRRAGTADCVREHREPPARARERAPA
jgi:hypothetical protein